MRYSISGENWRLSANTITDIVEFAVFIRKISGGDSVWDAVYVGDYNEQKSYTLREFIMLLV